MIDPKLLTKENGFYEGVAVEITIAEGSDIAWFTAWNFRPDGIPWCGHDLDYVSWDNIENIRPLTGPMSIWNHAPVWAGSVFRQENSLAWFRETWPDPKEGWTNRPEWAKEKE